MFPQKPHGLGFQHDNIYFHTPSGEEDRVLNYFLRYLDAFCLAGNCECVILGVSTIRQWEGLAGLLERDTGQISRRGRFAEPCIEDVIIDSMRGLRIEL